jgi:uncharacterized protein YecE (DUF72 family)
MYSWNGDGSLDWYTENSGLNAIELNASFYRFPFPNQVKAWAKKENNLAWSVKVNQLITHRFKLNKNSFLTFSRFLRLFKPLDKRIKFYLFQLPPFITTNLLENIGRFQSKFALGSRFALEARNVSWFNEDIYKQIRSLGITMVSVDSPQGSFFVKTSKEVYLRVHGRRTWYDYKYSRKELDGFRLKIKALKPNNAYVFFNNDHAMLDNGREMLNLLRR